jgi:hypothetical protein
MGLARTLHRPAQLTIAPGEAMHRSTLKLAAAVLGGFAVVTALAALAVAVSDAGHVAAREVWVVPLVAGGAVGLFSWYLLSGAGSSEHRAAGRATVGCAACGAEILDDWRLCPYCGAASGPQRAEGESTLISPEARG